MDKDGTGLGRIIGFGFLIQEFLVNALDDIVVLATATNSLATHSGEIFDVGLILGKLSKIIM